VHTFYCPEGNTEDSVALLGMEGAPNQHVTETVSAAQGTGTVGYIHGGSAGVVS
jgi:2,4'-dihydroxyacetophenone dioxygenase